METELMIYLIESPLQWQGLVCSILQERVKTYLYFGGVVPDLSASSNTEHNFAEHNLILS